MARASSPARFAVNFDPHAARRRLLQLVRERAYREGVDVVLASGKRSEFYVDGKAVTLHPEGLWLLARLMLHELKSLPAVTAVGGLTLGADPMAAALCALSHETGQDLGAFLVRKEPKGHGTGSRIEGTLRRGQRVAILEDTLTTGGSARKAIDAVREVGAEVAVVLVMVDREDQDAAPFRAEFDVRSLIKLDELRHG